MRAFQNGFMSDIPKLPKHSSRRNINILIDPEIDEIYREGKANGWDTSEIARRAVSEALRKHEAQLKKRAS